MNREIRLEEVRDDLGGRALRFSERFPEADALAVQVSISFNRTVLAVIARTAQALTEPGFPTMTNTRFELLRTLYLAASGRLSHGELAGDLNMGLSNLTHFVDSLEEEGLVERVPSATDRRVSLVQLTGRGAEACQVFMPRLARLFEVGLAGFSQDEKAALRDLLTGLCANLLADADDANSTR